jgi:THO complex subunit 5
MFLLISVYTFVCDSLGEFSQYVERVGRPYLWAQWLCGLQFLSQATDKPNQPRAEVSASHIEATIHRLRKRVKARLSLQKQLAALGKNCVMLVT